LIKGKNMQSLSTARSESQILATNKVLKNTYALLSATLFFSVVMAFVSMAIEPPRAIGLFTMLGAMGLIWFALPRTANSSKGLWVVFGITGLLGFGIGLVIVVVAMIGNIFFQIPALSLAISAAVIMIMSGFILHDTSAIIRGEQTNYILATVGMYLSMSGND
jgi:modulator of FtsH protease